MRRFIISLIAAVIIQIIFYSFLSSLESVPGWLTHWTFKLLLLIALVWLINSIWRGISGTQAGTIDRARAIEGMKLDQDVRQAILDRTRLAEQHLAEACGRFDSVGQTDLGEEARKAHSTLETFAKTLTAQPTGPGPGSAGLDFGEKTAERVVRHDKDILAIVEELSNDAIELASNASQDKAVDTGTVRQIAETTRRLLEQVYTREEILKGIK